MQVTFTKQNFYLLRFVSLIILVVVLTVPVAAQVIEDSIPHRIADTLPVRDTHNITIGADTANFHQTSDSVSKRPIQIIDQWEFNPNGPFSIQVLMHHPFFNFGEKPVAVHSNIKKFQGKELLFYVLVAVLLFFALLKQAFPKYFSDLFRVFFRTTLKRRQIREQLMQNPLPSFAFNIFYVISAGLYADFLLHYFKLAPLENFWLLYIYCAGGLSVIYFIKFLGLKIFGWIFNMKRAADSYIFIVFIINKVIGIFLLPVIIMLGILQEGAYPVILVLSWCGIGGLFLYRFILGYAAIRNEVRFNLFHFFLYLCSFEIAPLLLIYKLLLLVF